ncbi:MAG: hypothetical protein Q8L55_01560 [Phycisphaerales bacterium]|nr:hypothetical protein [Phycisphaerales bacterium]
MNLGSIKPQNLIAAAALLAPMVMVQGVRLLFGGGPDQASAQVAGSNPQADAAQAAADAQPAAPIVTAKQKAAIEHLTSRRDEITIFKSPFDHLLPQATAVLQTGPTIETGPGVVEPAPVSVPPEVRALSLGALMTNESGPFAVISGRVRSLGEVILPGWTVTAIDPTNRRVTVTSDDGVSLTLTQNR